MSLRIEEWQWQEGGTFGQRQRVTVVIEGPVQDAYEKFMEHSADCRRCAHEFGRRCAEGEPLWQAYRAARHERPVDGEQGGGPPC